MTIKVQEEIKSFIPTKLLRLPLQFFAEKDLPPGGGTGELIPPNPNDSTPEPETFTVEQVEAFKKEASQQAKLAIYNELGVKSIKDLQVKLKASETKDEADATLKSQNEQLNSENDQLKTERAFMQEAYKHTPHDIGLLFTAVSPLLQKDPDNGQITNMVAAIEQVKKEKPFLFVTGQQPQSDNLPPNPPQPGGGTPPAVKKGADLGKDLAARFNQKMKG